MDWPLIIPRLALGLAIAAFLLLAVAPLGWRAGWWHFRFAFTWLMASSGVAAGVAAAAAALTLALGWDQLDPSGAAIAAVALLLGLALAYVPWSYNRLRSTLPRIHDITTDAENPPVFAAVLPARAAESAASVAYEGPELAKLQRAAYADIAPLLATKPPAEAFQLALDTARSMPGWTIVAADPIAGCIEASQQSRWFGFTDDIAIRVTPQGQASRIDMRSMSRQGRSDFGVNAARIRAYMAALKRRVT
jgi:uncharacterized protein (DUF1499 family)